MSEAPLVAAVTAPDADKTLATLTAAFSADPFFRWVFPDAENYLDAFPRFIAAYCGSGIADGTAYSVSEFAGAAIWLAPGNVADEEAAVAVIEASLRADRREDTFGVLEQLDTYHPHDEPLWYLPFIGVDPPYQNRGLGSALMQHALELCDEQGTRAYLESSSPANIPLYERHGFVVMGRIDVGSAPPLHPMIREKR